MSDAIRQQMRDAYQDRNEAIYRDRLAGKTYTQLAKDYGLSTSRIRQIIVEVGYQIKRGDIPNPIVP